MPDDQELTAWVLGVIDRARSGAPIEDSTVELKAAWSQPKRAARQLAGHANSSGGRSIRWVVGVSEDGRVEGVSRLELSTWWSQVRSFFDGPAPAMSDQIVTPSGLPSLVVLEFDPHETPYVFRPHANGSEREIPWREATGTRSATRSEIESMTTPRSTLPKAHILHAVLTAQKSHHELHWVFNADLYVEADPSSTLVIHEGRCRAELICDEFQINVPLDRFSFHMPFGNTHNAQALVNQVAFRAPETVNMIAGGLSGLPLGTASQPTKDVVVHIELTAARHDAPFRFEETLVAKDATDDTWGLWVKQPED